MSTRLELVLRGPGPLEDRRVDRLQHEIVLRAREIQESEAIDVALILGRNCDLSAVRRQYLTRVWAGAKANAEKTGPVEEGNLLDGRWT